MAETDKPRRVLNDLNAVRNAPKPESNLGVDLTTVVHGLDAQKAEGDASPATRDSAPVDNTLGGTAYGVTSQRLSVVSGYLR